MNFEFYRRASVGEALADALDELIKSNQISPQLAIRILAHFDRSINEALGGLTQKVVMRQGKMAQYNLVNDVWQFVLDAPALKVTEKTFSRTVRTDGKVRLIACKSPNAVAPSKPAKAASKSSKASPKTK